jgi:hypothetical protein
MKKTIKDIEKATSSAVSWFKAAVYYFGMPVVLALGNATINWNGLINGNSPSSD